MKTIISVIVITLSVASAMGTAHAFISIDKAVRSINYKHQDDSNVIGHRVTSNGQFVLVVK